MSSKSLLFDLWEFDESEVKEQGNGGNDSGKKIVPNGGNGKKTNDGRLCAGGPLSRWFQWYADALKKGKESGDLPRHDYYELRHDHLDAAKEKGVEVDL